MAGIIHKIEEKLGMGGHKEGEKHGDEHKATTAHHGEHKPEHCYGDDHKKAEHKEGMVEKIKDKIHGDSEKHGKDGEKTKKKNKDKNKKKHGDGHSSSSDSDSD